MIRNYFKVAIRNFARHRAYAFINIIGLSVGMASAILIGLWINDELSFNKHYENYPKIARVRTVSTEPLTGKVESSEACYIPSGALLKANYGMYFKHILMGFWKADYTLSSGDRKFAQKGKFIEGGIIKMLSLAMNSGNERALDNPHSIILSKSSAEAIFGQKEALGKLLRIDNKMDVVVTGVFEDLPKNTEYGDVQFFAPWALWVASNSWVKDAESSWDNNSFQIEVQVADNVDIETVDRAINKFYQNNAPKDFIAKTSGRDLRMYLYPMSKWHLYSDFVNGYPVGGRVIYVWLFGAVGLCILLLACINFINLSTAMSEKRAKEVGVRKAIGSSRRLLVYQFLFESFLLVLISFLFSLLFSYVSLNWFNSTADKAIQLPFVSIYFWLSSILFVALTGLLSGVYPALYLANFKPIKVLKGAFSRGGQRIVGRKALVVFQFMVSIVLMSGVLVVYKQIKHGENRRLGYDKNGLLSVSVQDPGFADKQEFIMQELVKTGLVMDVAYSSSPITEIWNNTGGFTWESKDPRSESDFSTTSVSYSFGRMARWKFITGRDFSSAFTTDSMAVIVNESAAKHMGIKDPVGKFIKRGEGKSAWLIVGVIEDMVMGSPFEPVKRGLYFLDKNYESARQLNIRLKPGIDVAHAVTQVKHVIGRIVPSALFDYAFVDIEFARKFGNEQRVGKLAGSFSILAIFISCLGLFGLVSFVSKMRRKEIGVRKVLGASLINLMTVLCKEFVMLVCIAILFAVPVSWYILTNWLSSYQYRTELSWWVFAISGISAIIITLITISIEGVKTIQVNPVNVLRSE